MSNNNSNKIVDVSADGVLYVNDSSIFGKTFADLKEYLDIEDYKSTWTADGQGYFLRDTNVGVIQLWFNNEQGNTLSFIVCRCYNDCYDYIYNNAVSKYGYSSDNNHWIVNSVQDYYIGTAKDGKTFQKISLLE